MRGTDWINVALFGAGLLIIFAAGFMSGLLWERGTAVRRVMTGEDPPPWGPTSYEIDVTASTGTGGSSVAPADPIDAELVQILESLRPDVYDQDRIVRIWDEGYKP